MSGLLNAAVRRCLPVWAVGCQVLVQYLDQSSKKAGGSAPVYSMSCCLAFWPTQHIVSTNIAHDLSTPMFPLSSGTNRRGNATSVRYSSSAGAITVTSDVSNSSQRQTNRPGSTQEGSW